MHISKKGVSTIILLLIILFVAIILISFIFIFNHIPTLSVDIKEQKSQLIINKIISGKCFSSEYATIEKEFFTQDQFDKCFNLLDSQTLVKIDLKNEKTYYLFEKKENFESKEQLCGLGTKSNLYCTRSLPTYILFKEDENTISKKTLYVTVLIQ